MKTKLVLLAAVVLFVTSIVAFGRDHGRKIHRSEFVSINELNYAQVYKFDKRDDKITKRFGKQLHKSNTDRSLIYIMKYSNLLAEVTVYGDINANKSISYIMKHSNLLDEVNVYGNINTNESLSYIMKHSNLLDDVNVYGNKI